MKVKLEDYYKDIYTVAELEQAKQVIKCAKDDCMTATDYAATAFRELLRGSKYGHAEVIKAEATTAKNNSIAFNGYCEGSGNMDVCIYAIAEVDRTAFVKLWANVSDIWSIDGEYDVASQFYAQWFKIDRS